MEIMPKVTVLLSVYNGEKYLHEAMQSILVQTYTDFEFLIVDDGSTDQSPVIIRSFNDFRIRVLKNPERLKLSGALNRGMKEAKGVYIARMDADDIALPQRLQRQVEYMDQHPEVGMCGTAIEIFSKVKTRIDIYPKTAVEIKAYALFDCPFCHPTVMMRRDFFIEHDLWYDGSYYPTEDYELWARAVDHFPTVNLDEVLLRYRVHDNSMTGSDWDNMDKQATRVICPLLQKIGITCSDEQLYFHRNIGRGKSCQLVSLYEIAEAESWLQCLGVANHSTLKYNEKSLSETLSLVWYRICLNSSVLGFGVVTRYFASEITKIEKKKIQYVVTLLLSVVKNKLLSK